MMQLDQIIATYCEAWDEADEQSRHGKLAKIWAEDATYTDPTVHTLGLEQLVEHIGHVIRKYPGSRIELTSAIDAHHRVFRFSWRKVLADGTALPEGVDFGELSDDGKLQRIVGFFALSAAEQVRCE